jgi:cytochrome c-type biogenesis protein CcsB
VLGATALSGRENLKRTLAHGIWLAVALHTVLLIVRWVDSGHFPMANTFETMMLFSWLLAATYAIMQTVLKNYSLGMFVSPLAVLGLSFAFFTTNKAPGLVPILKSKWLYFHVPFAFASYAFFTLASVAAVAYFLKEYFLKVKRQPSKLKLPPLEWLDTMSYRFVSMGFPLLTIAIVTGAIWNMNVADAFWTWGPKQTWSLILWIIYGIYLHTRAVRGWRGRGTNIVLLFGFLVMLITFFGVNFLSKDMHGTFFN